MKYSKSMGMMLSLLAGLLWYSTAGAFDLVPRCGEYTFTNNTDKKVAVQLNSSKASQVVEGILNPGEHLNATFTNAYLTSVLGVFSDVPAQDSAIMPFICLNQETCCVPMRFNICTVMDKQCFCRQ